LPARTQSIALLLHSVQNLHYKSAYVGCFAQHKMAFGLEFHKPL